MNAARSNPSNAEAIAKALLDDQKCFEEQCKIYKESKVQDNAINEEFLSKLSKLQSEYIVYKINGNMNIKTYNGGFDVAKNIESRVQQINSYFRDIKQISVECELNDKLIKKRIHELNEKVIVLNNTESLRINNETKNLNQINDTYAKVLEEIEIKNQSITDTLKEAQTETEKLQAQNVEIDKTIEKFQLENEELNSTLLKLSDENDKIQLEFSSVSENNLKIKEGIDKIKVTYDTEIERLRNVLEEYLKKTSGINEKNEQLSMTLESLQSSVASLKDSENNYNQVALYNQSKLDSEVNLLKDYYHEKMDDVNVVNMDWDLKNNSIESWKEQICKIQHYMKTDIDNLELEQNIASIEMESQSLDNKTLILTEEIELEHQKMRVIQVDSEIDQKKEKIQNDFEINCEMYRNIINNLRMNIQQIKENSQTRLIESKANQEEKRINLNESYEVMKKNIEMTKEKITKFNDDVAVLTMEGNVLERKIDTLKLTKNANIKPRLPNSPPVKLQKIIDGMSESSFEGPSAREILLRKLQKKKKN